MKNTTIRQTARESRSLNGQWTFRIDPEDDGDDDAWYDPATSWEETRAVSVPHSWQEHDDLLGYTGTAWYRRPVDLEPSDDERIVLSFGAVDYETDVWVNGDHVGHNTGGYLPFEVEVTDAVQSGENVVVLRVRDPADSSEIPHGKQGEPWYTRVSGPWQGIELVTRPQTYVDDVRVTPHLEDDTATISINVDSERADATPAEASLDAHISISQDEARVAEQTTALSDSETEVTVSIPEADYWTPDDPVLYDVAVSLVEDGTVIDTYETYFGMRSVSYADGQLYLNGDPFTMRGALDQAYYPDTYYRPREQETFEWEIRTAKDLGFNLLRKHIKPPHPKFVELADRLGILVWAEPANPSRYTDASKRRVRDQLRGLIERDYNSPSVIAWSIYNEEWGIGGNGGVEGAHEAQSLWDDAEKQAYLRSLYHETREWDPTRLVCDNSGWAHVETDLNDYHEYFVSPDRAQAWEDRLDEIIDHPDRNFATDDPATVDSPILISEFGTWGFPDLAALREHYDGDPSWFDHDFLDDPIKRPAGVDERFAASDLPDVFGSYDDLAEAWQRRELVSVADVIESMRTREEIAGYVITEFSDIEWEFNGILDYLRDPKPGIAEDFATVNDEILVTIDPSLHAVEPGDAVTVDVQVVNDTTETLDGTIAWTVLDTEVEKSVTISGYGTTTVAADVPIEIPADAPVGPQTIDVRFETDQRTVTNAEPLVVVDPEPVEQTVYADPPLDRAFEANGIDVTDDIEAADIAVVQSLPESTAGAVEAGTDAIVVPDESGWMDDHAGEYRSLPPGESWNLVASLLYHDSPLLEDLTADERIGWAFEDLFPYDLIEDVEDEAAHVGSVEGWLANWASPLVVHNRGAGQVCQCTFRVTDSYGEHPTATALLHRLIRRLG